MYRFGIFIIFLSWASLGFTENKNIVTAHGMEKIVIGDFYGKAVKSEKLLIYVGEGDLRYCFSLVPHYPADGHPLDSQFSIVVEDYKIARISFYSTEYTTDKNIKVGDSAEKVLAAYGEKLIIKDHRYQDDAYYYFAWVDESEEYGVKYVISQGKVEYIEAGNNSIKAFEGACI